MAGGCAGWSRCATLRGLMGTGHNGAEADVRLAVRDPRGGMLGFWALIAMQFQRAFSDNALKWLVSYLVLEAALISAQRDLWFVLVVPLVFAIPFLLFSIPGGYFADRYSKRSVTVGTKVFGAGGHGAGDLCVAANRLDLAAVALFLLARRGRFLGRRSTRLLPELLPDRG